MQRRVDMQTTFEINNKNTKCHRHHYFFLRDSIQIQISHKPGIIETFNVVGKIKPEHVVWASDQPHVGNWGCAIVQAIYGLTGNKLQQF